MSMMPTEDEILEGLKRENSSLKRELELYRRTPPEAHAEAGELRHSAAQVVDAWENDRDLAIPMMNLSDSLAGARPAPAAIPEGLRDALHGAIVAAITKYFGPDNDPHPPSVADIVATEALDAALRGTGEGEPPDPDITPTDLPSAHTARPRRGG